MQFVSNNSHYEVEGPDAIGDQVQAYVNQVEQYVPALEATFALEQRPPFGHLIVYFGDEGPCYQRGGIIKLPATLNLSDPQHIYGGLFYQTVHGLLEGYVWLPDGRPHYLPKAGTVVLQVAALERIGEPAARQWAERFAEGWGCTDKQRPILGELVRVYRENGFGAIRRVYAEMGQAVRPTLHKDTLVCDLNRILRSGGVRNLIAL